MAGTTRDLARALRAAQRGDSEAFIGLWRAINPLLLRYLRITSAEVAVDAASATWVKAALGLECFPAEKPAFLALLVRIARDEATARRAVERRRPDSVIELFRAEGSTGPAEPALRLVRQLPADVAEMVALRVVVGLPAETVAEIVGVRTGAVRVAVQRGLRRTADALAGAPSGASGLLDPWALDRILDEGDLGVSRLDPAMRSLVTALASAGSPGAESDVVAARRAFARTSHRTRAFAPLLLLGLLGRRMQRARSLLASKGTAVAVGTLVLSAPAAVAFSSPASAPPAHAASAPAESEAALPDGFRTFQSAPTVQPSRPSAPTVQPARPSALAAPQRGAAQRQSHPPEPAAAKVTAARPTAARSAAAKAAAPKPAAPSGHRQAAQPPIVPAAPAGQPDPQHRRSVVAIYPFAWPNGPGPQH
jgi:RNA polymerase sigma-70 factor, ECF subfamily